MLVFEMEELLAYLLSWMEVNEKPRKFVKYQIDFQQVKHMYSMSQPVLTEPWSSLKIQFIACLYS